MQEEQPMLDILYRDEYIIAINKPHGLLVHRTKLAGRETEFALQRLRDQIGQRINPIHRIDRKTSGVLLFGFDSESVRAFQQELQQANTIKRYIAIVRGFFPEQVNVDYPLINDRGSKQEAQTLFRKLKQIELPIPLGKHQTSRYSLIEAFPKTGRMHQIRKHLNHLRHPIIGDRPHGCSKQNRLFKEKWQMNTMLLHAESLNIRHPFLNKEVLIQAPFQNEFNRMLTTLNLEES